MMPNCATPPISCGVALFENAAIPQMRIPTQKSPVLVQWM